ncbi:MAG TPA: aminotransferase class I/II-fold pyridoxal phosphate-dependent enzyme [Gaiellaceae bacterium]|nr:aminotransferase class I/II-fold pyridoxal phosphate-dependent enzyme [Gaiellaceae bacterium]
MKERATPSVPSVVEPSATLAADERVRGKIAAGTSVVHLAFGEAGLPVLPGLGEVLGRAARDNSYGSVAGSPAAREAAAGYFERRGLPTRPEQVVFAPGSKALLFALLRLLPGDVILARPSWVSYAAQAALVGKRVLQVPIGERGGVPDPATLAESLAAARDSGLRPGVLVVTTPDNPTGTIPSRERICELATIAGENDLLVISDEIYRDLAFGEVTSLAELLPDRTFVTSGLSKSMALGGWRIGFARLPDSELGNEALHALTGLASEVWSSLAAPMQRVAEYVLSEPEEVREHLRTSRLLHERTVTAAYEVLVAGGIDCRPPGGAFYLYPDFEPIRPQLSALGVETADGLAELLLDRFAIAVLSGTAFGDDPSGLRFRMATSLLYGRTDEERWRALRSDDPAALPWIRAALDSLAHALATLSAGRSG